MFRAARFNTIRRTLHTQAGSGPGALRANRLAFAGAASAVAVTYFAWRTSSPSKQLALDTNRKIREHKPNYCVPPGLITVFVPTAEKAKVVDHTAHLEPSPVSEPEPTSELPKASTGTPTTMVTQDDDESEGDSDHPQPGEAAFNPVTGEINWDCPCLGGMAHGPCGMQFREAFSCFVFSEQEPKGIDCVAKFKAMQDCFREHPDVYAEGMFHCVHYV
jgi:intermembrane space import and assembly protein 40